MSKNCIKGLPFCGILLICALILVGGFHEYISCGLSVAMSIYLLVRITKAKKLTIRKDMLTSAVVAICLCYGLSCIWAVDRGMAFVGFLKFLPLLLFLFCLQQEEDPGKILDLLPYVGGAMAVLSAIGMQIPATKELFSVAGRLAGFFQYPNTFAVFLLACELLILKKPEKKLPDYILLAVLVAGLLYTGSRTAFIVAAVANVAMLLVLGKKPMRIALLSLIGAGILLVGLLALDKESVLYRYLTISLTESTFVGRILYWADALPLLLKYPFGLGYMGYCYTQQSIQTGVYTVAYIHNDLLQMLLDIGWLPTALFLVAMARWFFSKAVDPAHKVILGAICLHSFFDFDLQYISIFFLVLLLFSSHRTDKVMVCKASVLQKAGCVLTAAVCLYMGGALMLSHLGAHDLSDKLYPYNTQNKLRMLEQVQDLDTAKALADDITAQNTAFYAPYSVYAKYYYSQGDFGAVIENGRATIERNPFSRDEYDIYCKMLISGIDLYTKAGSVQSADICKQELIATVKQFEAMPQRLSRLGKMIDDQPITTLSAEVQNYMKKLGE